MQKTSAIITSYQQVKPVVEQYKKNGKSIVLTQGCFDMIHIGHGRYLQKAKSHGDVLIVGVDSDAKVKSRKGEGRPVVPEKERLEMLTYLRSVDHVVVKPLKAHKWELIRLVKPDVLVTVQNTYSEDQLQQVAKFCQKVVMLKRQAVTSTSAKLRRLQIGFAEKFSQKLNQKVNQAIMQVLAELKL